MKRARPDLRRISCRVYKIAHKTRHKSGHKTGSHFDRIREQLQRAAGPPGGINALRCCEALKAASHQKRNPGPVVRIGSRSSGHQLPEIRTQ